MIRAKDQRRVARSAKQARAAVAATKSARQAQARSMTGSDAVFAELEAMSRDEQEEIAERLLNWIQDEVLAP